VVSSILLFLVLTSIYAVLSVSFLGKPPAHADSGQQAYASTRYASFSKAFVTLLGIATGFDSWTDAVRVYDSSAPAIIFFISFVIIVSICALNIIVSVLLEGFMQSIHCEEEREHIAAEVVEHNKMAGAIDPLLATLANFNSPQHLKSQLELLFWLWDMDDNGTLDFDEMNVGLSKLGCEVYMLVCVCVNVCVCVLLSVHLWGLTSIAASKLALCWCISLSLSLSLSLSRVCVRACAWSRLPTAALYFAAGLGRHYAVSCSMR